MRLVSSDMHRVVINHGNEYDTFRFASTVDVFVDRNSGYVSFFLLRYQILIKKYVFGSWNALRKSMSCRDLRWFGTDLDLNQSVV